MNTLQSTVNTMLRGYGSKGVITHITRVNNYGKIVETTTTADAYMAVVNATREILPEGVQSGDSRILVAWSPAWGFEISIGDRISLNSREFRVISVSDYYAGADKTVLLVYGRA